MVSKYMNEKKIVNGIKFDSKKEANYYTQLLALMAAGIIKSIKRQPSFILQEKFRKNGKLFREIEYRADFEVEYADGHTEIVDVKGMRTDVYKMKRKLFEFKFPELNIKEI